MKTIEIEYRAMMSEKQYEDLLAFLSKNGEDLGEDDKQVYFFVLEDKLLKVTENLSQKKAKITLKLTRIGQGSAFEEIEFPIQLDDSKKAVSLFKHLGYDYLLEPTIKRHNFMYKGIEFAVKYSKTWGFHCELEIIVDDVKHQQEAEKKIREVAKQLKLKIMTDEELTQFTKNVEKNYVHSPEATI